MLEQGSGSIVNIGSIARRIAVFVVV